MGAIPTRDWPMCDECGYRSIDEDEFVVSADDGFRCQSCNGDYEEGLIERLELDSASQLPVSYGEDGR